MDTGDPSLRITNHVLLTEILSTLQSIQSDYRQLSTAVDTIEGRVNILAEIKQIHDAANNGQHSVNETITSKNSEDDSGSGQTSPKTDSSAKPPFTGRHSGSANSSRIILTTYPGQSGIDPLGMNWGNLDPVQRGPVVVSRSQSTLGRRNGMRLTVQPKILTLTFHPDSNWRSWWLILNLSCASSCQQEP